MPGVEKSGKVQTTVRLPRPLYDQAKTVVEQRLVDVETFNEFVIMAIRAFIKLTRRKRIDQEFAGMAADTDYQKEAQMVAAEFEESDWEALIATEEVS